MADGLVKKRVIVLGESMASALPRVAVLEVRIRTPSGRGIVCDPAHVWWVYRVPLG